MPNLLTHPPALPLIAPSVLSSDFAHLADDCRRALDAGADLLHLDVMDGHFVPNLTMGPAMIEGLHHALPDAFLDAHLMVTDPAAFVDSCARAGVHHFTFHVEAVDDPAALAGTVREAGMTAGLAINPPTPVEDMLPWVEHFDLILVMSVNPGFSGQSFMPEVLAKTRIVSERLRGDQRLQMDGGVAPDTVAACRSAGCDVIVAGSAFFRSGDYGRVVRALRGTTQTVS